MEYYVPSIWHTIDLPEGSEAQSRNEFLEQYIQSKGYEVTYSMTLARLIQEDSGKVTGALFSDSSGSYVKINADNVILATGGYPGNPKMVKALAPIIDECVTANSYYAPDTGMGIWAGAKMDTECAPMIFDRGLVAPGVKAGYSDDGHGNLEKQVAAGLVFKADTIEDLAAQMGLPVDAVTATVTRYNELCEKGVDEDFGKEAYRMHALDTAPFYGYFKGGSLLTTCNGLRINRKCQVYNTDHQIIDGLYCIGDCSGQGRRLFFLHALSQQLVS